MSGRLGTTGLGEFVLGEDASDAGAALNRTATDTTTVTDDVARTAGLASLVADTTSVTEDLARTGVFSSALDDTVSTSETLNHSINGASLNLNRAATDSVSTSDAVTRAVGLAFAVADSASATDSLARVAGIKRANSDTTSVTDSILRRKGTRRTVTDTRTGTQTIVRRIAARRTTTDTVPTPTESFTSRERRLSDSVPIGPDQIISTARVGSVSGIPVGAPPPPWDPADGPPPPTGYPLGTSPGVAGLKDVVAVSGRVWPSAGGSFAAPLLARPGARALGRVFGEAVPDPVVGYVTLADRRAVSGNTGSLAAGKTDNFDRVVGSVTMESFSRVVASGPGISEWGPPWANNPSFSVNGNVLVWPNGSSSLNTSSAAAAGWDNDAGVPTPLGFTGYPIELLIEFRFTGTGSANYSSKFEVAVQNQNETEFGSAAYTRDIISGTDFSKTTVLSPGGSQTGTAAVAAPLGSFRKMRVLITATDISMKVWTGAEPAGWQRTRSHSLTTAPHHLTVLCSRSNIATTGIEVNYIDVVQGMVSGAQNWGLGPLGQWHNLSTLTEFMQEQPNPTVSDGQAWVDGQYGGLAYDTNSDDPTQGLFLTSRAITDPGGAGAITLPLDIEFRATWAAGSPFCYIQLYMGPAHHYDLNAWDTVTIQWYGPSDPTELYGMQANVGGQGWAQWPLAPDNMFGSVWFHGRVGETLAEAQTHGVRVKVHVDQSGSFAKAWIDDGRAEPADWQIKKYWDPGDPMYSRIAEFYRVIYFEEQVSERFLLDWVRIGGADVNVITGMVIRPPETG